MKLSHQWEEATTMLLVEHLIRQILFYLQTIQNLKLQLQQQLQNFNQDS